MGACFELQRRGKPEVLRYTFSLARPLPDAVRSFLGEAWLPLDCDISLERIAARRPDKSPQTALGSARHRSHLLLTLGKAKAQPGKTLTPSSPKP